MSNVKRKDSKNRNLRNGESQRKDGRYVYKYTDIYGKPQFIYSWKLVPTDKTPAGKRDDISLREKEAQIKKDLNDGIDTAGGKMTVCQLYEKKNSQRKNIKRATEKGRQYLMNALKNDPLGMRAIDTVKQSDAKEWAIRMSEKGYAYKTIDNYKRSLKASFYMAIQDDCIRKNPFEFKLSDVLEDDTEQKVILTPEQEERLLAFMEKDKIYSKYYDEVVLLLETGLRISEFCGLTTHIDMQNRILNIDHQLLKDSEIGYYIETPKTKNGKRELPLTERAYQAIQRILKNRGKAQPLNSNAEEIGTDRVEALVSASPEDEDGKTREEVVKTEIEGNDNNNLTIPQVVNRLGMVFFLLVLQLRDNNICILAYGHDVV
ncbi:integrase DNA-binding domain-containing protein [Clostridioides difficile]|uniref:integrase DNA-binding domain-containing protein n=1 Tax=Clostridioides difficile TaxID=1496 RepID=UPI0030CBDD34